MGISRKRAAWAALGLAALGLAGYGIANPTVEVRLTQAQVQERVDARLPVQGRRLGVPYSVAPVAVALRSDGRVGVVARVSATMLGRTGTFDMEASGVPAYRDGAFYVTGLEVTRLDRVAETGGKVTGWPEGGLRDSLAAMARETASSELAALLERRPVHVLRQDDFRQSLARLAMRDVRVEGGELVATLDVMSAALRVLLWCAVGLLALAAGAGLLLSGGGAFLAASALS